MSLESSSDESDLLSLSHDHAAVPESLSALLHAAHSGRLLQEWATLPFTDRLRIRVVINELACTFAELSPPQPGEEQAIFAELFGGDDPESEYARFAYDPDTVAALLQREPYRRAAAERAFLRSRSAALTEQLKASLVDAGERVEDAAR